MVKWLIVFVLTLLFRQTGLAQQGWFVGIGAEPRHTWLYNKHDYMYNVTKEDIIDIIYNLYSNHENYSTGFYFHYIRPVNKDFLIPEGFQFNLHGGYAFNDYFRISLGVGYESFYMHYERSGYTVLADSEGDDSIKFLFYKIGWPQSRAETLRERLHYLSVPLQFQYQFGTSNVKPFVEVGAIFRWLANYSLRYSKDNIDPYLLSSLYINLDVGDVYIDKLEVTKSRFDLEGTFYQNYTGNLVGPVRSKGRYENIFYNVLNVALNLGLGVNIAINNQWQASVGLFGSYSPLSVEKKYREDVRPPSKILTSELFPDGTFLVEYPFWFIYPGINQRQKLYGSADFYPDLLNRNGYTPYEERGRTVPISLGFQIGLRWFFEEW
ncbi:hypothetical protein JCM31826_13710 [Thermaurantimonas aggregans]|uniref:Outer membrane protein beta-barrel domain-containing protein n=1 Tax=Thermaurantimonas aggregans TaxID=2173829 RepID=A0A401XLJ5_9FLAO|nr:outer membrane beta-barrel protein [Thermaurantimonas aggregans]MCX8149136.1 outer membrane beta-barrel protein [Thermaurantimonas aggregans]GCD77889.1 hypothetical protein JCM31826_13710 [Thermaurantimonas aggregans]